MPRTSPHPILPDPRQRVEWALFRGPLRAVHGKRFDEALRARVADSILATGNGAEALRFCKRYPARCKRLAGASFPRKPSETHPLKLPKFRSAVQAVEYVSLTLIDHASDLSTFDRYREGHDSVLFAKERDALQGFERKFGYSNWLAGELIANLPLRSKEQVQIVNGIREDDKQFGLSYLFALERYMLSGEAQPSSNIRPYIRRKSYDPHLTAFLLAALDPNPVLHSEEVCAALRGSVLLSAVDRWIMLLRCAQSLVATVEDEPSGLSSLVAFRELLCAVSSVEASNLFREVGFAPRIQTHPPVSPLDTWLSSYVDPSASVDIGDVVGKALLTTLRGLEDEAQAPGQLAVLDRQAVALSGTRLGGMLAAIVSQVSAFSDRRSLPYMKWLRFNAHPALLSGIGTGNIGRVVRLRSAPGCSRERLREALEAAADGDDRRVIGLLQGQSPISTEESAVLLDSLLSANQRDDAIDVAAQLIVEASPIVRRLPFQELHSIVPAQPADELGAALCRAIVADACVRYGASVQLAKRNDCFEDVLELADSRLPHQAVGALLGAGVAHSHIAYFLETICTPNIMDTVPVGRSTEELLQERILVLNALCELRPERSAAVEPEIRQTAIVVAVKREMVSLDQRRVYVDLDGLRTRLIALLAADFERYTRFTLLDPRKSESATLKKYFKDTHGLDAAIFDLDDMTRAMTSEADGALAKMLLLTRDEFSTGHDFGLDGYLSGGIRHGNLEAHLREPFVKMELLGHFVNGDEFRAPALARRLARLGRADAVNAAFERFARSFQQIVHEVLSEWVRIETATDNARAMFQFQVTSKDRRVIDLRARGVESVGHFVDLCLQFWLSRLEDCLESARHRVRGELSARLHEVLGALDTEIRQLFPGEALGALADNLVAPARGALDVAIDKLAEWFRRVPVDQQGFVDATLPVEISANLTKQMFPRLKFTWEPSVEVCGRKLDRRAIKPWVDIIHSLYVNAAQESVRAGGPSSSCAIHLSLALKGDGVHLEVRNSLGGPETWVDVDAAVEEARQRLSHEDALLSVRMEGRSGLVKVLKWSRVDLRCPEAAVSVSRDENEFIARVFLPGAYGGLVVCG